MTRTFCQTSMGQVHCVLAGSGSQTPLVLLHQTPRSTDEYAEVMPLLARRRRVVAVDTPGYGCSDRVLGQPSISDYAGAIAEALTVLGIARAIVIGHHTGGVVGVELAAGFPERIERVVLSGPIYVDGTARAELSVLFKQWQVAPDGSHVLDRWRSISRWVASPEIVQRVLVDLFGAGTASEQGHFAVANYRMEDRLPEVRCPALLLYGAHDPFADPARCGALRAAFRPHRETTIRAGIFAANEAPAEFAAAVLDYIEGAP